MKRLERFAKVLPIVLVFFSTPTISQPADRVSVFVKSLFDNARDCQPEYPTPPPYCAKAREMVRELNKDLYKSNNFTTAAIKEDAQLVISIHPTFQETGAYAVRDRSYTVGNTTVLDVDVQKLKVKRIGTMVYRNDKLDEMFYAKSIKDLRKKLEGLYR
jgi:hypothetical protein